MKIDYIECGDCLELMKKLPNGSIDLILCDLPYGRTGSHWDRIIDTQQLWSEYRRIITDTGVIVLFGTEPFASSNRNAAFDLYKYDWIWHKSNTTGFAQARNMPLRDYENISVFSKAPIGHASTMGNKRMPFNPQGLKTCNQKAKRRKDSLIMHPNSFPNAGENEYYVRTETGFPRMVLNFNKDPQDSQYHINAKPVALLEYLIKTYTDEGEIVLDNCMGGGSTCIAAINTGRHYIGFEKDHSIFETAKQRIDGRKR